MIRTTKLRWLAGVAGVAGIVVLAGCGGSSAKAADTTTAPDNSSAGAVTTTSAATSDSVDLTFTGAIKLHAVGTKVHTCGTRAAQNGVNGDAGVEIGDTEYPGVGKYMSIEGTILPGGKAGISVIKWTDATGTADVLPTDNDAHTTLTVAGAAPGKPGKVTVHFAKSAFKNDKTQGVVTVTGTIVCTG